MLDRDYTVKFITSKNNFVFLSDKDFRLLDQDLLIRLSYGLSKTAYFSLGPPLSSLKEAELAISSVLAKELGLFKNDTVSLSTTEHIYSVNKLNILASSAEDYEILELLADNIQDTLLNQVRIVHNKQKLVIWVSHSMHVTVEVDGVLPISPGKLENLTEIAVLQPNMHHAPPALREIQNEKKRGSFTAKHSILNNYNKSQTLCRLHPIEDLDESIEAHYFEQPFNVFISKSNLPAHFEEDVNTAKDMHLIDLRVIPIPPEAKDALDETSSVPKNLVVRLFVLEDVGVTHTANTMPTVFANQCIFDHFAAKTGAKVVLEPLKDLIKLVKSVRVSTTHDLLTKADEVAKNYLLYHCQKKSFLINSNVVLSDSNGCKFRLTLDGDATFYLVDRSFVRTTKFSLDENELVADKPKVEKSDDLKLCLECCNYETVVGDVQKFIGFGMESTWHSNNVLIVGKPGTGKTSLLSHLSKELNKKPDHVHTETLKCKKLKGKNIDSLQKVLNTTFLRLIYYQPSVLLLDDLHVICEKVVEGEVPTQENLHLNKVSEMLSDILENYVKPNRISIVATGESVTKLNQHIFASRGKHLFKNVLSIHDLDKDDRIGLMKFFLEAKDVDHSEIDFELLGVKTEGFVVQDLIDYTDKVIFEAYKENVECDNIKASTTHCEEALKNTSSLSLREVQLHSPGERDFKDVGGLEDIKKILVESMMWPAQYPNIFSRAPLRLQSGLLLYGPPGTGKTILAGAAAKQCNMRLISIKGPELLSKYIGASEQAVRDVFQKAQNAKPCILFFDEFDSLAPRRGHDNTGVTDRVVNQFLTQLDGVESLNGVCVLAATSRPDLLDPALLRPGRLDRQILCPMPDRDSRLAILKALSKLMKFTEDVNLNKLADDTVGYSGADLQAVLYTAQLSSVEYLLDSNEVKHNQEETLITQKLLEDAVRTTRPSLTSDEKMKYERIYAKFQGKGDLLNLKSGKQKTTLA